MSKKKQKPVSTPKKASAPERAVKTAVVRERRPEFELIRFDLKAWIFIGACIFFFILFVALKWHNSSIPHWSTVVPDGGSPKRGLVAGEPLFVRSDEWLAITSFILSQEKNGFPSANEALGFGKTPLTFGLPTKNIVSVIRPPFWGYYFLDMERGFAWQWDFKIFPFMVATFLLLMLLTRNNFLISLFGSIWLLLSSAVQWWSINTEIFTFGCVSVISFLYILYAEKPKTILINGILFILAAYSFAMVLYPAYQVPMAYLLLALIIGYILKNKNYKKFFFTNNVVLKSVALGASLLVLMIFFYLFYQETKETINVITNTVYPGKRSETGGDFSFIRIFTDNFNLFMGLRKYPPGWGNICEASSFLLLFPIASILIIADFIKSKKTDAVLFSVMIAQVIMFIWMFIGFPAFLAKLTLFSTSPSYRTFYILGFLNVLATMIYLAYHRNVLLKNNIITKILTFVILFGVSYFINAALNKQAGSFFTSQQVLIASVLFSLLNWLVIFFNSNKIHKYAFFMVCFLIIMPNIKINPLSVGLSPYYENGVYKTLTAINEQDPGNGWVVYGAFTYGNFLKAAGINCFNGNQCVPPLDKLHILDPEMKSDSVYNRFAHIDVAPYINADSVKFTLIQNDRYSIKADPCSPRWVQMGIKYFLFTYQPQPVEVDCMTPVKATLGVYIYKRNDL